MSNQDYYNNQGGQYPQAPQQVSCARSTPPKKGNTPKSATAMPDRFAQLSHDSVDPRRSTAAICYWGPGIDGSHSHISMIRAGLDAASERLMQTRANSCDNADGITILDTQNYASVIELNSLTCLFSRAMVNTRDTSRATRTSSRSTVLLQASTSSRPRICSTSRLLPMTTVARATVEAARTA